MVPPSEARSRTRVPHIYSAALRCFVTGDVGSSGSKGLPDPLRSRSQPEVHPQTRPPRPADPALHRFVAGGWRESRIRRPAALSGPHQSRGRPKQVRGCVRESSSL
ncbi:Hypothetical predicted protein [Pelobates cultripes]|uniref:Uncharacterized protein n=1 Tax=Pelobates cultripes TaxID=61616 RepID=A0AAD1VZF5_PELCU|nr:Hypothetical predicted protein [Pelobates cultripes]